MAHILNVPDDYELVCFLPIGIPKEKNIIKTKKPFHKSEKAKNAGQKNKTKHTDFAYNSLDKGA